MDTPRIAGLKGPGSTYTPGEVATIVGGSLSAVYAHLDKGSLRALRLGDSGKIIITHDDLLQWLKPYVPASGRLPNKRTTDEAPETPIEHAVLHPDGRVK